MSTLEEIEERHRKSKEAKDRYGSIWVYQANPAHDDRGYLLDLVREQAAKLDATLAEKEAARDKRADELARTFSGWPTADFAGQPASTQLAILKVIELEVSK